MIKETSIVLSKQILSNFSTPTLFYYITVASASFCLNSISLYGQDNNTWILAYIPILLILVIFIVKSIRKRCIYSSTLFNESKIMSVSLSIAVAIVYIYLSIKHVKIDDIDSPTGYARNWMFWLTYTVCLVYILFNLVICFTKVPSSICYIHFDIVPNMIVCNILLSSYVVNIIKLNNMQELFPPGHIAMIINNESTYPILFTSITLLVLFLCCLVFYIKNYLSLLRFNK